MIVKLIYILCAATSMMCAGLLFRGWWQSRARFLLWACLCFSGLAINNALLFADLVIWKELLGFWGLEFRTWRGLAALAGFAVLLWGLVWDIGGGAARRGMDDRK